MMFRLQLHRGVLNGSFDRYNLIGVVSRRAWVAAVVFCILLAAAAVCVLLGGAAIAETGNDLSGNAKKPDVEDSAVLPDAGSAGPSAAPTMKVDCQKAPSSCVKPQAVTPENMIEQSK
jgi:hypothetical protein